MLADKYEILEVLGKGGVGVVYKARHNLMKRIVAVKMLHEGLVADALMQARFQQEAQAISALNHPNIMTVYDFGITDDQKPYLVVEFLEGTNLETLLQSTGFLPIDRTINIIKQACSGLAHAHEKGVIHRDLKPSNLMLIKLDNQDDFVKIVDFGIAKLVNETHQGTMGLTVTGEIFGSPLFMSPEQCRGGKLDARSDIYSLGCVIYRTLTGKPPFTGQDLPTCLYKHVHEQAGSFESVCPELALPKDLEAIVFKAMAKDPNDRQQSMLELKAELETFESGQPIPFSVPAPPPNLSATHISPALGATITIGSAPDQSPTQGPLKTDIPTVPPSITGQIVHSTPPGSIPMHPVVIGSSHGKKKNPIILGALSVAILAAFFGGWQYYQSTSPDSLFQTYMAKGNAAISNKDFAAAELNFQKAVDAAHKIGQNSMQAANAVDALGQTYYVTKQYEKLALLAIQDGQTIRGITSLTNVLKDIEKEYGQNSIQYSQVLQLLAKLNEKHGDYAEAESLYTKALEIRRAASTKTSSANKPAEKQAAQQEAVKQAAQVQELKSKISTVRKQRLTNPRPKPKPKQAVRPFGQPTTFSSSKDTVKPANDDAEHKKKKGFFGRLHSLFHKDKPDSDSSK